MPGLRGTCLNPQKHLQRTYITSSHQFGIHVSKKPQAACLPLIHVRQKSHKSSHPRHDEEWWTTERIVRRAALSVPIWEIRRDGGHTIRHLQNLLVPPNLFKVLAQNRRNIDQMSAAFPYPGAKTWRLSQASWTLTIFSVHMEHVLRALSKHRKPYPMDILRMYGEAEAQLREASNLRVGIDGMLGGRPLGERLVGALMPRDAVVGPRMQLLLYFGMVAAMYYTGLFSSRRENAVSSTADIVEDVYQADSRAEKKSNKYNV